MPVSSNPNNTAPYWLECDAEIPIKDRPVFLVRFLSQKDLDKHTELMNQAREEADNQKCYQLLIEATRIGVAGWRNMKNSEGAVVPFSDQAILDLLTDRERWELAWGYPSAVQLTKTELSFFGLPVQRDGARHVGTQSAPHVTSTAITP